MLAIPVFGAISVFDEHPRKFISISLSVTETIPNTDVIFEIRKSFAQYITAKHTYDSK